MKDKEEFGTSDIAKVISDYEAEDTLRKYTDRLIEKLQDERYIGYKAGYTENQKNKIAALIRLFRDNKLELGKIHNKVLSAKNGISLCELDRLFSGLTALLEELSIVIPEEELTIRLSNSIPEEIDRIMRRIYIAIFEE